MANPNMLAALGQWFGGLRRPSYRTPPFQRGAIPGTPAAPTPGMPMPMPSPVPGGGPMQAGAPGAPVQPPPQAGNPIWNALTNPNLGAVGLAAGQQLTRARYPGESGMSNAVSAVTAGYNQLAQNRAAQFAREQAERELDLKKQEQYRKNIDTNSTIAQRAGQVKRWEDMSTAEQQKYGFDREKFKQETINKENDQALTASGQLIQQQNADSLKAHYESVAQQAKDQLAHNKNRLAQDIKEHDDLMKRRDKEHGDEVRLAQLRANISAGQLQVAKESLKVRLATAGKPWADYLDQAAEDVAQQTAEDLKRDPEALAKFNGPAQSVNQKIDARAQEIWKKDQEMRRSVMGEGAPAAPVGANPTQTFGPSDQAEGRTGTINGKPVITKGGQWVAR